MNQTLVDWFDTVRAANHLGPILVSARTSKSLAFACRRVASGELWVAAFGGSSGTLRSTVQTPLGICGTEVGEVAVGGDAPGDCDDVVARIEKHRPLAIATGGEAWLAILPARSLPGDLELTFSNEGTVARVETVEVPAWPWVPTARN